MSQPTMAALFLTLAIVAGVPPAALANTIDIRPSDGERVHFFERFSTPLSVPLLIHSPVPVSVFRYSDSMYMYGETPMSPGEVWVSVKSDCSDDEDREIDAGGIDVALVARASGGDGTDDDGMTTSVSLGQYIPPEASGSSLLPPSSFAALWSYTSYWCSTFAQSPETEMPAFLFTEPKPEPVPEPVPPPVDDAGDRTESKEASPAASSAVDDAGDTTESKEASPAASSAGAVAPARTWATCAAGVVGALSLLPGTVFGEGNRRPAAALGAAVAMAAATHGTVASGPERRYLQDEDPSPASSSSSCRAVTEVLIDGCSQSLRIVAPQVRVLDVVLTNVTAMEDSENECTTNHGALLTFPAKGPLFTVQMQASETGDADGMRTFDLSSQMQDYGVSGCSRPVEGRPLVDAEGRHLQAEVCFDAPTASWSAPVAMDSVGNPQKAVKPSLPPIEESLSAAGLNDPGLIDDWTRRSLGEHASIASFAAFTLDLLTNGAPPDLVRDSLLAALDEVDHARVSFEVTSALAGGGASIIEPGPIPSLLRSSGSDMTALALGAAREGCVDETLSALAAAAEAGAYADGASSMAPLRERLVRIAFDEARHSSLAWRTVLWSCRTDADACESVRRQVFHPLQLAYSLKRRSMQSDLIEREWTMIHETLVPFVTLRSDGLAESLQVDCSKDHVLPEENTNTTSMVEMVALNIMQYVICGSIAPK